MADSPSALIESEQDTDNNQCGRPAFRTGILLALKIEQEPVDKSNTCSYTRRTKTENGGASAMTILNAYELEERTISEEEAAEMYAALSVENRERIIRQIAALLASQS